MPKFLDIYFTFYGFMLALAIFNFTYTVIIRSFLFHKAHESVWKAFIPYYGSFTQHKLTFGEDNKWFWFLNLLIPSIYDLYTNYHWARAWGKSKAFAIIYLFFPLICGILILLQEVPYQGPQKHLLNN